MRIMQRGDIWYLRRRLPKRYESIETRRDLWLSLHTDSEQTAKTKAPLIWQEHVNAWEARLAGDTQDAEARYQAAQDLAKAKGLRYLPATKVAMLPVESLLERIEAIPVTAIAKPDRITAAAVLGAFSQPDITLSRALEMFWQLARDRTQGKSEDQIRRWRYPRIKAMRNLIERVGDKALCQLTRDDMLDFRDWWLDKMSDEGLTPNSANKDLTHISDILKTVNSKKRLEIALPLGDLTIKGGRKNQRPSFSEAWIRDRILAADALAGLNPEARAIFHIMLNTGMRPSEIAGLRPEEIILDDGFPHISLQPIGRALKSDNAERRLPLIGVALEAARGFRGGFPSYRSNSATLSGTINKYMTENGLKESDHHTLYSLRHAFEDRMLAAGIDERIRRDLMGHALGRERYGKGGDLSQVTSLLRPISF